MRARSSATSAPRNRRFVCPAARPSTPFGTFSASSFRVYLIQVCRFKTIDALRKEPREAEALGSGGAPQEAASTLDSAEEIAAQLDEIEKLRACIARFELPDRAIFDQVDLILDRKWSEAGLVLGMAESTLRSRWPKLLDRIRGFMNSSDA